MRKLDWGNKLGSEDGNLIIPSVLVMINTAGIPQHGSEHVRLPHKKGVLL